MKIIDNLCLWFLAIVGKMAPGPVDVHVVYCGECGYGSRFRRFQTELEDEFGDDVRVIGESTPGITGYFEVTVGDELVHSKKNGDGFVDSKDKLDRVIATVNAALKA